MKIPTIPSQTARQSRGRRLGGPGAALALALLVLGVLAAGAVRAPSASAAATAQPCWAQVLNDWFVDGRIDKTYPIPCYTQAQQHIGEDARQYSSFPEDARRALLAAIRQDRGGGSGDAGSPEPSNDNGNNRSSGAPVPAGGSNGPGGGSNTPNAGGSHRSGPITKFVDWAGPSNASSIPLPLLVLGGIALLLIAAAGASFAARRIQTRRLRPAPAPARPPKQP